MKKKKTALMMAAVMTVSLLAACGQKTSAPAAESTAQPDAAQTTEASKEASQEESQAPAESTGGGNGAEGIRFQNRCGGRRDSNFN